MFFPIGDTQVQGGFKPYFSYAFIVINVLVFLYEVSLGEHLNSFVFTYGTIPSEIASGDDYFTLVTSMFLHGGWMHLIGNMMFLWIFADNIEATIGSGKFILFYFLGGLAASIVHTYSNVLSDVPAVGASGAISAILGAYMVMFPKSQIKVLVLIIFRSFYMSALIFLGLWFAQQLISGIGSVANTSDTSGVAWWAHIGGFVFGLIAGWLMKDLVVKHQENLVNRNREYV